MRKSFLYLLLFFCFRSAAQDSLAVKTAEENQSPTHKGRKWFIGAGTAAGYGGSFLFLSQAWYKDYPRSGFHTFNDNGEWLQMDKLGHVWTAYQTSRFTTAMWRWAGVSPDRSVLLGSGSSLLYMLSIEWLDGHSADWGWSWGDAGADVLGVALFASQELGWKEQRLSIKFSAHPRNYADPGLEARADQLFGRSFQGRLLKDYNAQTYWLSANLKSFFPKSSLPTWLNVSVGYGAEGMFGGFENLARNKTNGSITFDRRDVKRVRQWYLAPDLDLTKIKTRSKFLRTVFSAVNVLKFPAPALELSGGKLKFRALAF